MNKNPNRLLPVFYATAVMTLISVIPLLNFLNVLCCAGVMLGGFVGIYTYSRELKNTPLALQIKDGVIIAILAGIISAILVTGTSVLFALFSNQNPMSELMKILGEVTTIPPEAAEQIQKLSDEFNKYGFSPTLSIITLVINMILYPLFGSLGALIGFSVFKNKTTGVQV